MIKLEDLEGIKLVDPSNIASLPEAQAALESAFIQGSQGWGVRQEQGIILKLARDLKIAIALASTADENGRMLKGAQMELGRVKKVRDTLKAANELLVESVDTLITERDNLSDQLDSAKIERERLVTALDLSAAEL